MRGGRAYYAPHPHPLRHWLQPNLVRLCLLNDRKVDDGYKNVVPNGYNIRLRDEKLHTAAQRTVQIGT